MSAIPLGISRVSNLLQSNLMSQDIDSTQSELMNVENQLSTGQAVSQPSDDPSAATMIIQLQQTLSRYNDYSSNINTVSSQLAQADSSLGSLTTLLQQAQQIASADVNSDVSDAQRQSDAGVVQSLFEQAMSIANSQYNGQYVFGGASNDTTQPFVETDGIVSYAGSSQTLENEFTDGVETTFQVSGANVFGSLATGVTGSTTLSPALTAATRVVDVGGADNDGVSLGTIQISDGTTTKSVDLSSADSIGDVVNLINAAGVGSLSASISGQGITISGNGSENITVSGQAAEDLGIATPSTGMGAGVADAGSSLNPKVTDLTPLSELRDGAGLDSSGLTITNGAVTKTITWPAGGTVQDLLNAINGAGLGVQASINSSGTGINVMNAQQGTTLSIGENGGSTAAELGLQTLSGSTLLSSLNGGAGVQTAGGTTDDFSITNKAGTTFQVALGSATTVQDVINAINSAAGASGVSASLASTGSGIVLTDSSSGSGTLTLTPENNSTAAAQLGLTSPATGNQIIGTDVGAVTSSGVFGNLQALLNALESGNQEAITAAGSAIQTDTNRVIALRGQTGSVEQQLTDQQTQITSQNTQTQSLISSLQDVDYTTAITQFQTLQTALQASLQTTADSLQLSLLDFLT